MKRIKIPKLRAIYIVIPSNFPKIKEENANFDDEKNFWIRDQIHPGKTIKRLYFWG